MDDEDEYGDDDEVAASLWDDNDFLSHQLIVKQKEILALKEDIRRKDKDIQFLKAALELSLDQKFRALVDKAGVLFTSSDRGREVLSPRSDILLSNLRSVGCSVEKLPEIL